METGELILEFLWKSQGPRLAWALAAGGGAGRWGGGGGSPSQTADGL